MRHALLIAIVALAWNLAPAAAVHAQGDAPLGGCASPFELHRMMDGGEHMHHHIGSDLDRNGDGYLCVRHVGQHGEHHLHIDNRIPCEQRPESCVVTEHGM